jgi:4-hydroxy-2-oxoheptanedioate aldolase
MTPSKRVAVEPFEYAIREELASNNPLIGTMLTLPGATLAELTAPSFDIVCLDLEHGALGRSDMSDVLVGVAAAQRPILVRVPSVDSDLITVALDCGCAGLVFPNIETKSQVEEAVARCSYPPLGRRGFGPRRAGGHGRRGAMPDPLVVAQIESRAGLNAVDEIASVNGLDVLLVGTADLSYSLGVPGRVNTPEIIDGVAIVVDAAVSAGIHVGVAGPPDAGALARWSELPISMYILSTEARIFTSALDSFVLEIRRALPRRG